MKRESNVHNHFDREAILYEPLEGELVRCGTCWRRCLIRPGEVGFCQTRENINGTLVTHVFGRVASLSINPIEKKPFYHFYPGSVAVTLGTSGCTFDCPWCQNYELSRKKPSELSAQYIGPTELLELTNKNNAQGVSYSFNEPTLQLEHALATFPLTRQNNLYNTFVSNGYMTFEALALLIDCGLDAMNIDIKGDRGAVHEFCGVNVEYVWRAIQYSRERGVHIEITTLVIPGVNDEENGLREIARRIKTELGANTPYHLSRYFPQYKFRRPATPVKTLEQTREIALEEGLNYVYIGNVPGHPGEHTYCPNCGTMAIKRYSFYGTKCNLTPDMNCLKCGAVIPIVGRYMAREGNSRAF